MKIALFGGTFDPVHNGHVKAAESALRFAGCNEVWFVPVYWHVYKKNSVISDIVHRKKMIALAIGKKPGMRLVDFNTNPTYTIDTIHKAKAVHPGNEFVWVIGSDLESEFDSWKDASQIVKETKVIIIPEPGFEKLNSGVLSEEKGNCLVLWKAEKIGLNSTIVREKLCRGENIASLLGPKVLDYINKNNLYKNNCK